MIRVGTKVLIINCENEDYSGRIGRVSQIDKEDIPSDFFPYRVEFDDCANDTGDYDYFRGRQIVRSSYKSKVGKELLKTVVL